MCSIALCTENVLRGSFTEGGVLPCDANRPISQIPQCIRQISHNVPFCSRNVHTCAHFCYKMMHHGIWDWGIMGFVRGAYLCHYWCRNKLLLWQPAVPPVTKLVSWQLSVFSDGIDAVLALTDFTHMDSSWSFHWHWDNHTIIPVPVKQPWSAWVNVSREFIHCGTMHHIVGHWLTYKNVLPA